MCSKNHLRLIIFLIGTWMSLRGVSQNIITVAGASDIGDLRLASKSTINDPEGLAVDRQGNVYFTEGLSHRIRRISTTGVISTIAGSGHAGFSGDGGAAQDALLNYPAGIVADNRGNIYFSDWGIIELERLTQTEQLQQLLAMANMDFLVTEV